MKRKFNILLCVFLSTNLFSQTLPLVEKTILTEAINETSGLIFWDDKVITHNDSGGKNALFEVETATGEVLKTIYLENVVNNDWEDITQDEDFIYIGDFGNNNGNRTNLSILKISKTDYLATQNDTIPTESILFNYADQVNFTSTQFQTNYDAEAIIAIDSQLVVFSKNWGDNKTRAYFLPKEIGNYSVSPMDSFDINGLVTAAYFHELEDKLFLVTYEFLYIFENVNPTSIFGNTNKRYSLEFEGSTQVEAICATSENQYLLSTESFLNQPAKLYEFELENPVNSIKIEEKEFTIFPNPVSSLLTIYSDSYHISSIEILNSTGKLVQFSKYESKKKIILEVPFEKDVYFLKITTKEKAQIYKRIMVD